MDGLVLGHEFLHRKPHLAGVNGHNGLVAAVRLPYPLLQFSEKRWLQHIAFWLCLFEVLLSVLFLLGSMVHYGDPRGFRVRMLGFPITMVWSSGGQFVYFALRALAFAVAAILIATVPRIKSNKDTADAVIKGRVE